MAKQPLLNLSTNEEIIEELTKDLKSSTLKEDDIQPKTKAELQKGSEKNDPWENIGKETEEENENAEGSKTPTNDIDEDLSDEEHLKDRDLNLTNVEKEVSIL